MNKDSDKDYNPLGILAGAIKDAIVIYFLFWVVVFIFVLVLSMTWRG